MCPLDIPYTFIPGTKAKANEVNSNFNTVKTFVDQNEVDIAQNEVDINNLQSGKADINGNISNTFQVADPVGNYDAVNKQYFKANIANTLDYISGFKLTKQSDTSVSATAGSCYDSTFEYMITQSTSLTKDQENLGDNATYYVYVCADKESTTNQLIFSLSSTTPELPADYDYFRRLGSFTTNDSGVIDTVITDSSVNLDGTVKEPSWSDTSARSTGTTYTADEDGWVFICASVKGNNYPTFKVNNITIATGGVWKYDSVLTVTAPIFKGNTYVLASAGYNSLNYQFIPSKVAGG